MFPLIDPETAIADICITRYQARDGDCESKGRVNIPNQRRWFRFNGRNGGDSVIPRRIRYLAWNQCRKWSQSGRALWCPNRGCRRSAPGLADSSSCTGHRIYDRVVIIYIGLENRIIRFFLNNVEKVHVRRRSDISFNFFPRLLISQTSRIFPTASPSQNYPGQRIARRLILKPNSRISNPMEIDSAISPRSEERYTKKTILRRTLRRVPVSVVRAMPCEPLLPTPSAITRTMPGYTAVKVQLIRLP